MSVRLADFNDGDLVVRVLEQSVRPPFAEERRDLAQYEASLLIREVTLLCRGKPWMYGRSLYPQGTIAQAFPEIEALGEYALGKKLFEHPELRRSAYQHCLYTAAHEMYARMQAIETYPLTPTVWARRSSFLLNEHQIMLTEVFLPACIEAISQTRN